MSDKMQFFGGVRDYWLVLPRTICPGAEIDNTWGVSAPGKKSPGIFPDISESVNRFIFQSVFPLITLKMR